MILIAQFCRDSGQETYPFQSSFFVSTCPSKYVSYHLVGMADIMMVGRLGPSAIAVVGMANQPILLITSVFMSLTVGTTALIAAS